MAGVMYPGEGVMAVRRKLLDDLTSLIDETDMTIYKDQSAPGTNSQMSANPEIANSYIQLLHVDNA